MQLDLLRRPEASFKCKGWIAALCLILQSSLSTQDGVNPQQSQHTHRDPCRDETFFPSALTPMEKCKDKP